MTIKRKLFTFLRGENSVRQKRSYYFVEKCCTRNRRRRFKITFEIKIKKEYNFLNCMIHFFC